MYLKRMITFELPGADIRKLDLREKIHMIKEIGAEIVVMLKVYAYLNAKFNGKHILKEIPDSQCIRPDGSPIGINNVIMMCISSPSAEYFNAFKTIF